jgi:hypothetical protein
MPDQPNPTTPFEKLAPWSTIPIAYADGVMSHAYGAGVSKFYLYRIDSDPNAKGDAAITPVAQIVMPSAGLVRTWAFLGKRIKTMVEDGYLTQEQVDELAALATSEPET